MASEFAYIVSDYRSGSTLLDQLLGAHADIVTVGEIVHLPAYAREDRELYDPEHPLVCSCGKPISRCPFWTGVESRLGRPLADLRLYPRLFGWQSATSAARRNLRNRLRSYIEQRPLWYERALGRILLDMARTGRDSADLLDAVAAEAGCRVVVDASKHMPRFRALQATAPERTRLILLCRDYRGVIYSKMKRGRSLEDSAVSWANRVDRMAHLARSMSADRVIKLRYEDLCEHTDATLLRVFDFLGVSPTDAPIRRSGQGMHHIGGSPSKFDDERAEIIIDERHKDAFSPQELDRMHKILGPQAAVWGYGPEQNA